MLSKISNKVYKFFLILETPKLLKIFLDGGMIGIYENYSSPWIKSFNIQTILDIGANTGQFTKTIDKIFPNADIYSFEPLSDCFNQLEQYANKHSNIKVFNVALGEESTTKQFKKNDFSASSSFLEASNLLKDTFPFTRNTANIDVNVVRLDDVIDITKLSKNLLVKMDVQGYEDKVIRGGENTIKNSTILVIESSTKELYESQPLFKDIFNILDSWGFKYVGNFDQIKNLKNNEILQVDAVFINANNTFK